MILKVIQTKELEKGMEFVSQDYYEGETVRMFKTPEGLGFNVYTGSGVEVLEFPPHELEIPSNFAIYLMENGNTIDSFHVEGS